MCGNNYIVFVTLEAFPTLYNCNLMIPDAACPIVGQVTTSCASACPPDCWTPPDANLVCPTVCATCECSGANEVIDYITGKCVQREQCTGKLFCTS